MKIAPFTFCTLLVSASFLLFTQGCMGYRLGSTLTIKSVYVPTVTNNTDEPFLETEITQAIKEELQRDGSLSVENEGEAEAILQISVNKYYLKALAYDRDNRTRANEYRVYLEASAVLTDAKTGEEIVRRGRLLGDAEFEFAGDQVTARRQALPRVSNDLAHDIVEAIVETW